MCSCPSSTSSSTTWAASVPADLTDTIAAAVGVQPVRAQAPLRLSALEQPQAASLSQTSLVARTETAGFGPGSTASDYGAGMPIAAVNSDISFGTACSAASACGHNTANAQAAVSNRLSTLVEVQAASPPTDSELEQHRCSSSAMQHHWRQQPACCTSACLSVSNSSSPPPSTAVFDDMDDVMLQVVVAHSRSSSFSESDLEASTADADQQYFQPPSSNQAWHNLSNKHTHEQQQLLCQLWSSVHTPVEHLQPQHFDDTAPSPQADSKASSCCNEESLQTIPWPAARSSFESSGYSSSELQSSPNSTTYSRASSVCSSRSDKRVTWGAVTEYQLPPQPQGNWFWTVVPQWLQGSSNWSSQHACVGCSPAEAAVAGAAAAGLVIALVGAAAFACPRRFASA